MSTSVRGERRYQVRAECEVRAGDARVAVEALDVSRTGVRVRALSELPVGAAVHLMVRVPGSSAWIEAEGEVTRRIEGRRAGDDGKSYGIRLRRMGSFERRLLTAAACWFPEAAGGRGEYRDPDGPKARRRGVDE